MLTVRKNPANFCQTHLKRLSLVGVALAGLAAVALSARAFLPTTPTEVEAAPPSAVTLAPVATQQPQKRAKRRNLSLQPEAFNMSRRLGKRFRAHGQESSLLVGRLTTGGESRGVRLMRVLGEEGERVEVGVGGPATLTWDAERGPLSSGRTASGDERLLLERLVLDSPDQFVLAQLRGASYYTVAYNVRPAGVGPTDEYAGPLYNVIRVSEGERGAGEGRVSPWRLYYINVATGLIEKVISEEHGERVEATFSGWTNHAGELLPTHITWTRQGQIVMEFTVTNVAHGSIQ